MLQTLAIIGVPSAMVLVSLITGVFNWNISITTLRREEDEKRGQRIAQLEGRIVEIEASYRAEFVSFQTRYEKIIRDEQDRRNQCESVIYSLRGQILILRGALIRAGIDLPKAFDPDYS